MYLLRKLFHPEIFQGGYKRRNYFEGWYYKLIDRGMENVLVVIPGVAFGEGKADSHAFIQVMETRHCKVKYLRYDISSFKYDENRFELEIAGNYFSDKEIRLDIQTEAASLQGQLSFQNIVTYPRSLLRPGIMGPYSFVPFMECYHGIVNIHHEVCGQLAISGSPVDFTGGYGYIEKDWGRSFPEAWIWLQSNHFDTADVSLMFSTAKIPWLGRYFTGFISFLRIKDAMYTFATYTRAEIVQLSYSGNELKVMMRDRRFTLEIDAKHSTGGTLKAPKNGLMEREILESISAVVRVKLTDRKGRIVFEGQGTNTGMEIVEEILKYYEQNRRQG